MGEGQGRRAAISVKSDGEGVEALPIGDCVLVNCFDIS